MHHIGLYGASLNKKEKYGGCMGEEKKSKMAPSRQYHAPFA